MMILMATGSRIKNKIESPALKSRLASVAKMSPNTTCRRTVYHHWRACLGRFFGGPGDCMVLDTTWNTGMCLFLFITSDVFIRYGSSPSGRIFILLYLIARCSGLFHPGEHR